jgi:clan AA aspartic protease (TIGR02281 family)
LAYCYFDGIGTQKNNNLAIYWASRAKDAGDNDAEAVLNSMKNVINSENKLSTYDESMGSSKAYIPSGSTVLIMKKINSIYYVPCKINGLKADFVFDTGAGMISLSSNFAEQLIEMGRLSEKDIIGNADSKIADGSISQVLIANIKDVEIGGLHLYNVKAAINEQQNAPLLLGQSAIEKLGRITIDGYKLIIHRK